MKIIVNVKDAIIILLLKEALDGHIISVKDKSGLTRNVRIKLAVYRMSKKLCRWMFWIIRQPK